MKIELECISCNKSFITEFKHRNKKFCDKNCYFDYAKKNKLFGKTKDSNVREIRTCVQCGKELTEWEIMKLKNYDRIWDCGSLKFELVIKNGGR